MYEFTPLGEGSFFKRKTGRMAGKFVAERHYLIDGEKKCKAFYATTKKAAKARMASYEEQMYLKLERSQHTYQTDLQEMTTAEWIYCWLITFKQDQTKPSTYTSYLSYLRNQIVPHLDHIALKDLDTMQLQIYYNGRSKDLSPASVRKLNAIVSQALDAAVDYKIISQNPAPKCKKPKIIKTRPRVLTHEEQEKFLTTLSPTDPFTPIYLTMLGAGLRIGEALALNIQDIDFTKNAIHVSHTLPRQGHYTVHNLPTTKDWEDRYLPLSPPLKTALKAQITRLKELHLIAGKPWTNNTFIFQTSNLTPYCQTNVLKHLKRLLKKAGLPDDITNHTLRHTFATRLVEQGTDISIVKELLGHEDISTTADYYIDISTDLLDAQLEKISAILA